MMLVRQLMGPYAGQVVEMPYAVAQNCIASGTACLPEDHKAAASVKGLVIVEPVEEPVAEVVAEAPAENAVEMKKPKRRRTKKSDD